MGLVKGLKQARPQLFVIIENEILKLNIFIKSYYNNGFNTNENSKSPQNLIKLGQAKASQIISFLCYNYTMLIKYKKFSNSITFNDLLN
jgi:hypothetical protein